MAKTIIGLIADTHIPDRAAELNPHVVPLFSGASVSQIFHAGDISVPRVLKELEQAAPVTAVRGNRDWFGFKDLPLKRVIEIEGKRIGLIHGHVNWRHYARDKFAYFLRGPQSFEFFARRAAAEMRGVDALVFGHNHEPMVREIEGILVINPGSACCQVLKGRKPSIGFLYLEKGKMQAEIAYLQ